MFADRMNSKEHGQVIQAYGIEKDIQIAEQQRKKRNKEPGHLYADLNICDIEYEDIKSGK